MASGVWNWFKRAGHYLKVGIVDVAKFMQTSGFMNLVSLLPAGGAIATGLGVFERGMAAASAAEQAAAIFAPGVSGTGPQKLLMAAPDVELALYQLAQASGFKVNDPTKAKAIANAIASAGADFWNIIEPVNAPSLPTPNVPATPAPTTK